MKESSYNITLKDKNNKNIIYNSLTKALVKVDLDTLKKAIHNFDSSSTVDVMLKENGFIVEDSYNDELYNLKFLYNKSFFDSDALNIILVPTFGCNLNCPYCFESSSRSTNQDENYYEIIYKFAKTYFINFKYVNISLFGGEPLLEFQKLDKLLDYVLDLSKQYGFTLGTSITTNGTLINDYIMEKLFIYNCKTLQITLDGSKDSHDSTRCYKDGTGSFDEIIEVINNIIYNYIIEDRIKFILRINLNNNSVEDIKNSLNLINYELREKIDLVIRPIYNTDMYTKNNKNDFNEIKEFYDVAVSLGYKIMKNNYYFRSCEACGDENFFYLTPDLKVWKCINNMHFEGANIGRINSLGEYIIDIDKISNWYKAADCFSDSNCKNCKLLPDCLGGCILYKMINGNRKCSHFDLVSLPYLYG